jgi:hypothetical protein
MRPAAPSPTLPLSGGGSALAPDVMPMWPSYSSKISFTETTDSVPAPPALLTPDTA